MRSSLEHLPERKQRELARVIEIIHEELADALEGSSAAFKKRGRILKIILFGSYARGTWVDEPHTMKGYRSDYDILVIVSSKKLAEPQYWDKAPDRLMWEQGCLDPGGIDRPWCPGGEQLPGGRAILLRHILREGIVLYELDDRPLAKPKQLAPVDALRVAKEHFEGQTQSATEFQQLAAYAIEHGWQKRAAFLLHQAAESAYSCLLLTLTTTARLRITFFAASPRIRIAGSSRHGRVNSTASRPGTTFSTKPM